MATHPPAFSEDLDEGLVRTESAVPPKPAGTDEMTTATRNCP